MTTSFTSSDFGAFYLQLIRQKRSKDFSDRVWHFIRGTFDGCLRFGYAPHYPICTHATFPIIGQVCVPLG